MFITFSDLNFNYCLSVQLSSRNVIVSRSISEAVKEDEDEDIFNETNRFRGPPLHKIYAVG